MVLRLTKLFESNKTEINRIMKIMWKYYEHIINILDADW